MSNEQMMVLEMLSDGRITAVEAERRLVALTGRLIPARRRTMREVHHGNSPALSPPEVPAWTLPIQM